MTSGTNEQIPGKSGVTEEQKLATGASAQTTGPTSGEPGSAGEAWRDEAIASEWGFARINLSETQIPDRVRQLVPRELAECCGLVPFAQQGGRIQVAVSDPLAVEGVDRLSDQLGLEVDVFLASGEQVTRAIERFYPLAAAGDPVVVLPETADVHDSDALHAAGEPADATVITLVHELVAAAINRRASDIHLEPLANRFRVRLRVDGVLVEAPDLPKNLQPAIISRLKIMANISIAERRLPQDGRIPFGLGRRTLDLRASSLPTVHGESMVLRILDRADLRPGLAELGLMEDDRRLLERLIAMPNGLVLATGPTGSGKTTTLYGCLQQLNHSDRKLITVEDPVEYQLAGVNQVPVREESGLTFGTALRAMLRQAPNIVMVGEIRDRETAEIALQASLTGHMVFSTLHTNDAPGAITRLLDLGVQPFLLSSALRGVVAQRLVRRICPQCSQPHSPTIDELAALGVRVGLETKAGYLRGVGCAACNGTGFRGRVGIFELLAVTDEISQMIHERPRPGRLREVARAQGMHTLREDGARKAIAGLTTIEEVVSMTTGDAS